MLSFASFASGQDEFGAAEHNCTILFVLLLPVTTRQSLFSGDDVGLPLPTPFVLSSTTWFKVPSLRLFLNCLPRSCFTFVCFWLCHHQVSFFSVHTCPGALGFPLECFFYDRQKGYKVSCTCEDSHFYNPFLFVVVICNGQLESLFSAMFLTFFQEISMIHFQKFCKLESVAMAYLLLEDYPSIHANSHLHHPVCNFSDTYNLGCNENQLLQNCISFYHLKSKTT